MLEAPTDDPVQVTGAAQLKANKARLRFYERYGALPIVGTLYDQPIRPGVTRPSPDCFTIRWRVRKTSTPRRCAS